MTTTVSITAHCSPDKQVQVNISDKQSKAVLEEFTIQDSEFAERYVYDDREITISEVLK